ncbi:MAG: hypothetical protein K6E98_05440 [Lachnospiraceae bacterium]|nr:hypothetical protein [Lachnospiraceae bacterium]
MSLKAKNSKENLADMLIEEQRLKQSFESSSAAGLKKLETSAEKEEITGRPEPPVFSLEYEEPYEIPRKKRGRPYKGYAENTHVQSIYISNEIYDYLMTNYVGHGKRHSSFNKFVNGAINYYLRMLEDQSN